MVYDIIPAVSSAIGTVEVNASIYTADCFAVPSVDLPSISGYIDLGQETVILSQYTINIGEYNVSTMNPPCA